jgi:hypothetical protein
MSQVPQLKLYILHPGRLRFWQGFFQVPDLAGYRAVVGGSDLLHHQWAAYLGSVHRATDRRNGTPVDAAGEYGRFGDSADRESEVNDQSIQDNARRHTPIELDETNGPSADRR